MGAKVEFVDHDRIEVSNLNRQFFTSEDLGQFKSHALLENIAPYVNRNVDLVGYAMTVQEFSDEFGASVVPSIYSVGVDNDEANIAASRLAHRNDRSAIFTNVSRDGEACRIFIQRPGEACFACYKPSALTPKPKTTGCPRTPAIADILQIAAGLAVRAIVGELLGEPIGDYTCRDFSFSGFDHTQTIQRREDCPLCGHQSKETKSMSWQPLPTDKFAEYLRFLVRGGMLFNAIALTIASVYLLVKLLWFSVRFLDGTMFAEPW